MRMHLVAVTVVVSSSTWAQVAVLPPHAINFEPAKAQAFAAVCEKAYREVSGLDVVETAEGEAGHEERLELSFIGLSGGRTSRVVVNGVRRGPQGALIHEATLEALSLDEAPLVCSRLATALVHGQPVEDTQTHRTVTGSESTKRSRRLSSNNSFGLKTGVTVPFATNDRLAAMGSLGFDARLETERWFYELGLGFMIPAMTADVSGYGGFSADLGANYYLTDTDFAPYVGVGLEPRLVFSSGSGFNLVPFAQVGATLSRKSGVRMFADARVGQNVLPAVAGVYPTEVNFTLGVGF